MSAHALRGLCCSALLLCFGKKTHQKHTICWQQSVPGSPQALAASWLLWLELGAKLGMEAAPNPTAAWPQPSTATTSTRRGLGWPAEEGTLPSMSSHQSLGKFNSQGKRATQKEAMITQKNLQSFPYRLFSPRTWLFSQTLPTDKIYPL